ncbi:ferredoxin--NADP reductase [Pseudonocardia endophytica]|uniref:Ring-1,2-phenylacetyl-CoA epoxidase subunit PaaE n=1 Tax=Pseudonocardia endophytica TaxID=401976 RepID=A0A4R1HYR2_PSEEN|nr:ferredoxin--NADP reductase [Pseudonocardia endophytica]TCK26305.1 ring-1,2-phenylacetyl-CoA epoxidase subunit PaaE [Pseudonocardia endophytica]
MSTTLSPSPTRRALVFHPLTVARVVRETPDSVALTFDVPPELAEEFTFRPGQHLTLRHGTEDDEVRRSYSLCSTPGGPLRIGVRKVDDGRVSTWLADEITAGDEIELLPPLGSFVVPPSTGTSRRLSFVAAGSGITPVLAMVSAVLAEDPDATVTLLVLNRTMADAMFVEELQELKSTHLDRLQLTFCCTREQRASDPLGRRPTGEDLRRLRDLGVLADADHWFLCGPHGLLDELTAVLTTTGVPDDRIHHELFTTGREAVRRAAATAGPAAASTRATVTFLGRSTAVPVPHGATLLDAARAVRRDLPYSCEAGVCSTCRALVREGEVESPDCPGLTSEERDKGFVLACQATAAADSVELDFDI